MIFRADSHAHAEAARISSKGRGMNLPRLEGESLAAYAARLDAAADAKHPRMDAPPSPSAPRFG